jgi:1,4-dihydroxy-2-naphthoyl-CoA hydrolase
VTEPNLADRIPSAPIHQRLDIEVTEARSDRVVGTMPVEGNTQPFGLLHGGASILLAESLASIGAALQAGPGRLVVGIEVSASHHRSAAVGTVTGTATPLHSGRTLSTWQVQVCDDQGRVLSTARITCLMKPAPPTE